VIPSFVGVCVIGTNV